VAIGDQELLLQRQSRLSAGLPLNASTPPNVNVRAAPAGSVVDITGAVQLTPSHTHVPPGFGLAGTWPNITS